MAKYVLAYRGGSVPESESEQQAVMDAWMGWFGSLGAAVVDGGNPFGPAKTVASNGGVSDGGSAALTGYSVIDATDLDDATAKAKGCPVLESGGTVDVYETIEM
jgi:hypothetical protein